MNELICVEPQVAFFIIILAIIGLITIVIWAFTTAQGDSFSI